MKNIVILGSTGALGIATLDILEKYKNHFIVMGISGNSNNKLLNKQAKKLNLKPEKVVLASKAGEKALIKLSSSKEVDIVINVLSGIAGVEPSIVALKAKKTLLLANKESIVAEGDALMKIAENKIIPLDSEHNAIFEILKKFPNKKIKKLILPCSGGPFLGLTKKDLESKSIAETLNHPVWKMGKKISIESATLINKGLEVIEAHYLFNVPLENIEVLVHPECQIHGVVEFENNESLAYISKPDMLIHLENGLRHCIGLNSINFEIKPLSSQNFNFQKPNHETFPGIKLTLEHFKRDRGEMKSFLKKEEETIERFLNQEISFLEIFKKLREQ